MSDINRIMSITTEGKVTINFRQKPLPNPVPHPPSSDEGSSTASTGGQSPPSQVDPQSNITKSMAMKAIRNELKIRQHEDNREVMEETDQLYEGLQQVIADLHFRMDDLEWTRAMKRPRRE